MVKCEYNDGYMRVKIQGTAAAIAAELSLIMEKVMGITSESPDNELVNVSGTFDLKE